MLLKMNSTQSSRWWSLLSMGGLIWYPHSQCLFHQVDRSLVVILMKPTSSENNLKQRCVFVGLSSSRIALYSGRRDMPPQWWTIATFCTCGVQAVQIQNVRHSRWAHKLARLMYWLMLLGRLPIPCLKAQAKFLCFIVNGLVPKGCHKPRWVS